MKKIIIIGLALLGISSFKANAQNDDRRVITTAVPFLLISSDARASGLGDQGVATSPDSFSQQWNPAKFAFSTTKHGVGLSYTPYLSSLVNDIGLGNLSYSYHIDDRSAVSGSLRYFSLGDIEFREDAISEALVQSPNELTVDLSYALQLSPTFSMAVGGRYLRSDLRLQGAGDDATAADSFGVDIAGFYQSDEIAFRDFNGRWRAGFNISNIGPKISYDDTGLNENFIPTNLKFGAGFDFILDEYNKITPSVEFNKLLVPTPISPEDTNGNGEIDQSERDDARREYNEIGAFSGIFSSLGDAPDSGEELKEFTWALGAEYSYRDVFAFRGGYFNESEEKGARKFVSLGAGFKYTIVNIDISYLFSTSAVRSPLEGTLRFGVSFNFGEEYFAR